MHIKEKKNKPVGDIAPTDVKANAISSSDPTQENLVEWTNLGNMYLLNTNIKRAIIPNVTFLWKKNFFFYFV